MYLLGRFRIVFCTVLFIDFWKELYLLIVFLSTRNFFIAEYTKESRLHSTTAKNCTEPARFPLLRQKHSWWLRIVRLHRGISERCLGRLYNTAARELAAFTQSGNMLGFRPPLDNV